MNTSILLAAIEAAGVSTLRIFATGAFLGFLAIGAVIFRRRHQLFDRDSEVDNDSPAVRDVRVELVAFTWSGVMLALLAVVYEVWRA